MAKDDGEGCAFFWIIPVLQFASISRVEFRHENNPVINVAILMAGLRFSFFLNMRIRWPARNAGMSSPSLLR